jgi:hypothetical protein
MWWFIFVFSGRQRCGGSSSSSPVGSDAAVHLPLLRSTAICAFGVIMAPEKATGRSNKTARQCGRIAEGEHRLDFGVTDTRMPSAENLDMLRREETSGGQLRNEPLEPH